MHLLPLLLALAVGVVALAGVAAWGLLSLGLLVISALFLFLAWKLWPRRPNQ